MEIVKVIFEFIFIIILQGLGIGFHVGYIIIALDKQYPEKNWRDIRGLFFENELSSLGVSLLILILNLVIHTIVLLYYPAARETVYHIPWIDINLPYVLASFITSFIAGYGGQGLAYKILNKMKKTLEDKVDKK